MMTHKYNGWTNQETWLAYNWLTSDESTHRYWCEVAHSLRFMAPVQRTRAMADQLRAGAVAEMPSGGFYGDLLELALESIDWLQLAATYFDECVIN